MTASRPAPGSNAALLRRRRRILRWSAPVLVVAVVAGAKLLAMSGAADVTLTAFLVGNEEFAARAADTLAVANLVEAYKAPFDAGTVAAASATTPAELRRAARLLNRALALAPADGECAVRFNLALVLEASGKAAGTDLAAAQRLFRAAATTAAEAPASCVDVRSAAEARADADAAGDGTGGEADGEAGDGEASDGGDAGGGSAADDLSAAATRSDGEAQQAGADLAAEQAEAAADEAAPADEPAPAEQPGDQALRERSAKAQAQQQEAQDQQRAGTESSGGTNSPDVATPW